MNLHEFPKALELAKNEGLTEYELLVNFELAEIDLKNEEYIKAENGYEMILKKLEKNYKIMSTKSTFDNQKQNNESNNI